MNKKNTATSGKLIKAVYASYGYGYFLYKLVTSTRVQSPILGGGDIFDIHHNI
jgi:hypothetical protein